MASVCLCRFVNTAEFIFRSFQDCSSLNAGLLVLCLDRLCFSVQIETVQHQIVPSNTAGFLHVGAFGRWLHPVVFRLFSSL